MNFFLLVWVCVCLYKCPCKCLLSVNNRKEWMSTLVYVLIHYSCFVVAAACEAIFVGFSWSSNSEPFSQQASVLHQPTSRPPLFPASSRPSSTDSLASLISPTDILPWRLCTPTACRPTPPRAPPLLTPSSKPSPEYSNTQVRSNISLFTMLYLWGFYNVLKMQQQQVDNYCRLSYVCIYSDNLGHRLRK